VESSSEHGNVSSGSVKCVANGATITGVHTRIHFISCYFNNFYIYFVFQWSLVSRTIFVTFSVY
jgi:hypothetical protein